MHKMFIKLTSHAQRTILRRLDEPEPQRGQNSNPNNGTRTDQQCQTKQHSRQNGVIQIEKGHVVTQSFHQQRRRLFHIKRTLFPDTKADSWSANLFPLKERTDHLTGAFGNRGRGATECFVAATGVPFFFAAKECLWWWSCDEFWGPMYVVVRKRVPRERESLYSPSTPSKATQNDCHGQKI